MKKYKLKQRAKDVLFATVIGLGFFEGISLMSWRFQQLDEKYIQEEYTKKTDTSQTYISQN